MPEMRTSLPAAAVVAVWNRCSASRWCDRLPLLDLTLLGRPDRRADHGRNSEQGKEDEQGCTDTSSPMVMTSRTIQLSVESTAMYMWSSTKIWLRRTASRSR